MKIQRGHNLIAISITAILTAGLGAACTGEADEAIRDTITDSTSGGSTGGGAPVTSSTKSANAGA
ncbi:MAG TPA: hypothetical protein VHG72_20980, partial [Polyangia bacterium]|nr:hypothetical protein [Polyangia bacterium]